jgi:hypothetical protein
MLAKYLVEPTPPRRPTLRLRRIDSLQTKSESPYQRITLAHYLRELPKAAAREPIEPSIVEANRTAGRRIIGLPALAQNLTTASSPVYPESRALIMQAQLITRDGLKPCC